MSPRRHIDLTREELAWLYREAFGFDLPEGLTDDNAIISILMQRGFAWARKKIADRATKNGNTTNHPRGEVQC